MTKRLVPALSPLSRGILALGLLVSSVALTQAAPTAAKKARKQPLPQLEQEVRTVTLKKPGRSGGISEKKLKVHVLYATATMDAFIDTTGDLYVQPKVSSTGNKVCGAIWVNPRNLYFEKKDGRSKVLGRKVLGLKSSVQPCKNPKVVTLNLELVEGVKSTVVYTFDGKKIITEIDTVDPKGLEFPTLPRVYAIMPPSDDLPIDASMAAKKNATSDCLLTLKSKKYTYADFVKGSGKERVSSGAITGQWPGCKVELTGRPGVGLWVYPGSMLFEGFHILSNDPDKPEKKNRLGISVVRGK